MPEQTTPIDYKTLRAGIRELVAERVSHLWRLYENGRIGEFNSAITSVYRNAVKLAKEFEVDVSDLKIEKERLASKADRLMRRS